MYKHSFVGYLTMTVYIHHIHSTDIQTDSQWWKWYAEKSKWLPSHRWQTIYKWLPFPLFVSATGRISTKKQKQKKLRSLANFPVFLINFYFKIRFTKWNFKKFPLRVYWARRQQRTVSSLYACVHICMYMYALICVFVICICMCICTHNPSAVVKTCTYVTMIWKRFDH